MIIVKIIGGLGNQMFQYAYAHALQENGYKVKLDISELDMYELHDYGLNYYDISLESSSMGFINKIKFNVINRVLNKMKLKKSNINENSFTFDEKLLLPKDNSYINGYFQSEKYFLKNRNILLKEFILKKSLSDYSTEIKKDIDSSLITTASLHLRRGDYLKDVNMNIHGLCSIEYYEKSIDLLNNKFTKVKYFVFSDDIAWVKENLKIEDAIYVESKEKRIPHEDIYLMSLCQHNVIANSSFSWWGAWLNHNFEKVVIAPKKWFNDVTKDTSDLISKEWIRL